MAKLSIPTVHLNGTSSGDLKAQVRGVHAALGEAIEALAAAAPHGRDYYVQSDTAYSEAVKAHLDRVTVLRSMQADLLRIHQGIDKQLAARYPLAQEEA